MNFAAYCRLDAVNASSLKAAAVSPLHYHYGLTHERPDTAAMAKGRAIHCATLEPDEFPRRYTVWKDARRGKPWTEFSDAAADAGLEILTQAEYDDVLATRDAVRAHPVAARYLLAGHAEETITWVDHDTDLPCKARVDFIAAGNVIVDLKTSRDIGDRSFGRTTHDLLYYVSAAHYLNGMRAISGEEWRFVFIAVESNPPHDVRVGPLSEDALYCGEQEAARLLRLVADCTASGVWPGAYPDEDTFDLPAWFYAQGERADIMALEGLTLKGDK